MLTALLDPQTQMPRSRLFWVVLGAVALAQIVALWLLCSQQVHKAQARHQELTTQQLALADCVQHIPGATLATCAHRIDGDATRVSFHYR